jgi:hypothetical protein
MASKEGNTFSVDGCFLNVLSAADLVLEQGCQIFLGTTYQNGEKHSK